MQKGLFIFTRWSLKAGMVLSGFLIVMSIAVAGWLAAVGLNIGGHHMGMPASLNGLSLDFIVAMTAPVMLALVLCFAAILAALLAAQRIVDSAMTGDPFVAVNAARLVRIGWLLLAVQLVGTALNIAIPPLARAHGVDAAHGNFHLNVGLTPTGLLAVLMIFVLAQVFRRGSEMRAELEGMV